MENVSMKTVNMDILINYVFKLWMGKKKMILEEFGLSWLQYEVMTIVYNLSWNRDVIMPGDLTDKIPVEPIVLSSVLSSLKEKKLVFLKIDEYVAPKDSISLTAAGRNLYRQASSKLYSIYDTLYNGIDERMFTSQLLQFSDKLNKLNN